VADRRHDHVNDLRGGARPTVVNVALPRAAGNLSASTRRATWVLTSYLVANTSFCLPVGSARSSDKRFLTTAIVIFTTAPASAASQPASC
jgi:MFS family permease